MVPMLKEASTVAGKSPYLWFHLGYGEFFDNNFDAAATAFRKALKYKADDARSQFWLGYTFEKQGDAGKALKQYRKALELSPDYVDAVSRFEGIAVGMRADFDASEKLYEELLKLAPNEGWIRNNFALQLRNWAEARGAGR